MAGLECIGETGWDGVGEEGAEGDREGDVAEGGGHWEWVV